VDPSGKLTAKAPADTSGAYLLQVGEVASFSLAQLPNADQVYRFQACLAQEGAATRILEFRVTLDGPAPAARLEVPAPIPEWPVEPGTES
jgi:hypothetical protein